MTTEAILVTIVTILFGALVIVLVSGVLYAGFIGWIGIRHSIKKRGLVAAIARAVAVTILVAAAIFVCYLVGSSLVGGVF